jgi:hypothetical protein
MPPLWESITYGRLRQREPKWIEEANYRSPKLGLERRFNYELGNAEAISFPDCAFDIGDKTSSMFPSYASREQQVSKQQCLD